jgi:hypothetical protein
MTQQLQPQPGLEATHYARPVPSSGGAGWLTFAAVMFIAAAVFNALWGISALVNDDHFRADELLFGDLSMWGAIYLGLAVLLGLTAILIIRRHGSGIILGCLLAMIHGVVALMSIGAYPLWSVVLLVIDGLIIYGLTVHGVHAVEA